VTASPPPREPLQSREPLLRALIDICGPGFARVAGTADTVAGSRASFVAAPATTDAVVETMRLADARGLAVVARGSGTKIDWGVPPPGVDLLLDTVRLAGVWHHHPEEMTAEVGTGTPVRALQAALALRGQRLAADPPSQGGTLGGVLAVNECGPLRHRYGPPAGQVNKVAYVDAAGVPRESDGEKGNPGIAEIPGVMLSANLRLEPLPEARRWVRVPVPNPLQMRYAVEETLEQDLTPSAIEVDLPIQAMPHPAGRPPGMLAILLEGAAAAVDRRAQRLAAAIGDRAEVSEIAPRWWGRYPFGAYDIALRISVAIEDLHAAVYAVSDAAGGPVPVRGSAGLGSVHAVLPGSLAPERVEAILDSLRNVLMARGGRAVIVSAPPETARQVEMASRGELF
jgi:glycolate oxidase FAD binding subunit